VKRRRTLYIEDDFWEELVEEAEANKFPSVNGYISWLLWNRGDRKKDTIRELRGRIGKGDKILLPTPEPINEDGYAIYKWRVPTHCPVCGIKDDTRCEDKWGGDIGVALWVSSEVDHLFGCRGCGTQNQKMEMYSENVNP
jgi:hypothetical protein